MNALKKTFEYLATGRGMQQSRMMDARLTITLWLHLPIALALGYFFGSASWMFSVAASVIIALPPTLLARLAPGTTLSRISIGIAVMSFSALLIHLSGGMVEYHFHIFVFLGVLAGYRDIRVLLASAGFIAVHHLSFNYLLPFSLFPYGTNLLVVILHAAFVIVQTGYLIFDIMVRSGEFDFVKSVNSVTVDIESAAEALTDASERISSNAQEQAASVEEISASVAEITSQMELATKTVRDTRTMMGDVQSHTNDGNKKIGELVTEMEEMEQYSKNMSDMLKSIESIAFQTNLLALNAAVEAARAGDSGRGFAVVAEEVRNLAIRAAEAAQDISGLVESMMKKVSEGSASATEASGLFTQIHGGMQECMRQVQAMATATDEQTGGIRQISKGLEQIDQGTQNNSAEAMEGATRASQLSSRVLELNRMLSDFTNAGADNGSGSGHGPLHDPQDRDQERLGL